MGDFLYSEEVDLAKSVLYEEVYCGSLSGTSVKHLQTSRQQDGKQLGGSSETNMKIYKSITLCFLSLALALDVNAREPKIEYGSSSTLESLIHVHGSPSDWVKVNGKKFKRVIGYTPYYVAIPSWDMIVLVQSDFLNETSLSKRIL